MSVSYYALSLGPIKIQRLLRSPKNTGTRFWDVFEDFGVFLNDLGLFLGGRGLRLWLLMVDSRGLHKIRCLPRCIICKPATKSGLR